jgi:two-component system OmpR family sensor kinase
VIAWLRPGRASLRVRVTAAAALLVTVSSAMTGFLGSWLLRQQLIERDDEQLRAVAHVVQRSGQNFGRIPDARPRRLPGNVVVFSVAGGKIVHVFSEQPEEPLPHLSAAQEAANTGPLTVRTVGHEWRVTVQATSAGQHLVLALSIDDINATVGRLVLIDLMAGAGSVVVLAFAGLLLVRASLTPLTRIEETAEQIAAGNLSERIDHPNSRTEVGRLAAALNTMLGNVEAAYLARAEGEAQARDSEERMRQFVADASHELRTPLTAIRGLAEFGLQQGSEASHGELIRLLTRVQRESVRMGLLVDDLLLLAQLDQDRPLELGPVDLASIAAESIHAARAVQPGRPIALLGDPDPVIVLADSLRLRQVIDNLVSNALRHTPADTPVSVLVCGGPATGDLVVSDHGPGMTAEHAARAFERFYRTDNARSRASGGTGLGLSIVAALVTAHGGTITLDTSPGRGAAFRVSLQRFSCS